MARSVQQRQRTDDLQGGGRLSDHDGLFELSPERTPMEDDRYSSITGQLGLLPGLGPTLTDRLHSVGIRDMRQLVEYRDVLPRAVRGQAIEIAHEILEGIEDEDVKRLCEMVPRSSHWRVATALPRKALFLDIETTGLSHVYHEVTLVGMMANSQFHVEIGPLGDGQIERIAERFVEFPLLVTFNGVRFDLPFLRANYPSLPNPQGHADLMYLARNLGMGGRLKDLERSLGIARDSSGGSALTGGDAPALWYRYIRGDLEALENLVQYNYQDVVNLRHVLNELASIALGFELPRPYSSDYVAWRSGPDGESTFGSLPAVSGSPRFTFSDLRLKKSHVVVGIDLTGSESRPSGWALLNGAHATTLRIASDAELIQRTIDAGPDLVSIDAPLSLPAGRTDVLDSDPERSRGIVRVAERVLWSRGVSAYPALIKSMQQLTGRGIRLASALRARGVPVIESYPGALQDILGMPRKGVSLDELKLSLVAYGLIGEEWQESAVTHDEIDALSSAIAGQFFLADRYEAIGSAAENFLIIPSLELREDETSFVIGLSGRTAAGKSTVARMLQQHGFATVSMSSIVATMESTSEVPINRDRLQELGERISSDGRQRELSLRAAGLARLHDRAVVDGVRFLEDLATFKEEFGLRYLHLHIEADDDARRRRFLGRLEERGEALAPNAFEIASASVTESQVNQLSKLADVSLTNDGTLADLKQKVLNLLRERVVECQ